MMTVNIGFQRVNYVCGHPFFDFCEKIHVQRVIIEPKLALFDGRPGIAKQPKQKPVRKLSIKNKNIIIENLSFQEKRIRKFIFATRILVYNTYVV